MKASCLGRVVACFNSTQPLDDAQVDGYIEPLDSPYLEMKALLFNPTSDSEVLFGDHLGPQLTSTLNKLTPEPSPPHG